MKTITTALVLMLAGCAGAYTYTDNVSPLGIEYRMGDGAAYINSDTMDFIFEQTMECMGRQFEASNMLVISTTEDVNPLVDSPIEGWVWQHEGDKPTMVVVNVVDMPGSMNAILQHEFVHVIAQTDEHHDEAFDRCAPYL